MRSSCSLKDIIYPAYRAFTEKRARGPTMEPDAACCCRYGIIMVRLDNVTRRKFRWLSTAELQDGCGAEAWTHIAGDAQDTILLIEGPLKADIVHYLTGMTLVAVSGVSSLGHLEQTLALMREQGVRKVMTAFDMDMMTNCHVQKDFRRLTAMLQEMGLQFGTYLWDPRFKGLDDYVWAQKNK